MQIFPYKYKAVMAATWITTTITVKKYLGNSEKVLFNLILQNHNKALDFEKSKQVRLGNK